MSQHRYNKSCLLGVCSSRSSLVFEHFSSAAGGCFSFDDDDSAAFQVFKVGGSSLTIHLQKSIT